MIWESDIVHLQVVDESDIVHLKVVLGFHCLLLAIHMMEFSSTLFMNLNSCE